MIIKNRKIGRGRPLICVSVTAASEDGIRKQFRDLSYENIDAVEWRADFFNDIRNTARVNSILDEAYGLFKDRVFIFTIRTKAEGGNMDISADEYERLILDAAGHRAVDLTDCQIKGAQALGYTDPDGAQGYFRKVKAKGCGVIASYHDFEKTPPDDDMYVIADRMRMAGADIPKCAFMPKAPSDTYRVMGICRTLKDKEPDMPLIFISMGACGMISRITSESFGSCLTFGISDSAAFRADAGMSPDTGSAPGQLNINVLGKAIDSLGKVISSARKLYLIGFMGAGKSVISVKLSELTGCDLVDMDDEIVRADGRSIKDIFADDGEEYFRDIETAVLKKLADESGRMIISCGGGTPLRRENADIMKKSGDVIWLNVSPRTVLRRVERSNKRPVLNGHMNVEYISELMHKRQSAYEYACTDVVPTDTMLIDEVAKHIRDKYF